MEIKEGRVQYPLRISTSRHLNTTFPEIGPGGTVLQAKGLKSKHVPPACEADGFQRRLGMVEARDHGCDGLEAHGLPPAHLQKVGPGQSRLIARNLLFPARPSGVTIQRARPNLLRPPSLTIPSTRSISGSFRHLV